MASARRVEGNGVRLREPAPHGNSAFATTRRHRGPARAPARTQRSSARSSGSRARSYWLRMGGMGRDLLGRDAALVELARAAEQFHLVTITGPPGVGKTRLARAWLTSRAPAGFVDLTAVHDAGALCAKVAELVDAPGSTMDAVGERIGDAIRSRQLRAVGLDNCEQSVPEVRALTHQLLPRVPDTALVLTSRQPLRVRGERVLPLAPLADDAAVELLRGAAIRAGASPDAIAAQGEALREIARLVDR